MVQVGAHPGPSRPGPRSRAPGRAPGRRSAARPRARCAPGTAPPPPPSAAATGRRPCCAPCCDVRVSAQGEAVGRHGAAPMLRARCCASSSSVSSSRRSASMLRAMFWQSGQACRARQWVGAAPRGAARAARQIYRICLLRQQQPQVPQAPRALLARCISHLPPPGAAATRPHACCAC